MHMGGATADAVFFLFVTKFHPEPSHLLKNERRVMLVRNMDVAVIGGGIAGLVAANDLARAGKSVVVFEKSSQLGGRAITIRKKGALFNLGGHALYRGGAADRIFRELGLRLEGGSPPRMVSVLWKNKVMPLPRFLFGRDMSWKGRMELLRVLAKLDRINADTGEMNAMSVREWVERELRDPTVRSVFYALFRTGAFTHSPDLVTVGPALRQVRRAFRKRGVLYVQGGWQSIVDQLREQAVRAGAVVAGSTAVEAIGHEDGEVRRLHLSGGETVEVGFVVAAVPPAETCRLVRDAERTSLKIWKDQAKPITVACLDLCLRRLPVPSHNLVLGIDQPVFFTNQTKPTPSLTEDGSLVIHLIKYNDASGAGASDPKRDEAFLEQTMDRIQPGWRNEIVVRQFLPNMTVVGDFVHTGRIDKTPGPVVPEIRGLYVAGDWASHSEALVDAAAASGRRAAQRVLRDLRDIARAGSSQADARYAGAMAGKRMNAL